MEKHKFYQKYANLPVDKRLKLLEQEIKEIDEKIREEELLEAVEEML